MKTTFLQDPTYDFNANDTDDREEDTEDKDAWAITFFYPCTNEDPDSLDETDQEEKESKGDTSAAFMKNKYGDHRGNQNPNKDPEHLQKSFIEYIVKYADKE